MRTVRHHTQQLEGRGKGGRGCTCAVQREHHAPPRVKERIIVRRFPQQLLHEIRRSRKFRVSRGKRKWDSGRVRNQVIEAASTAVHTYTSAAQHK